MRWSDASPHECLGALMGTVAVVWVVHLALSKTAANHVLAPEHARTARRQTRKASYPIGWYRLCATRDITAGQVKSLDCLGQRLVAFRGRVNGRVSVLDAHCTHMGAHMGTGRVNEDCLACPFHGWEFDRDGVCRKIPYDAFSVTSCKIPDKSRMRSWPCVETNDSVYLWYAPSPLATAACASRPSAEPPTTTPTTDKDDGHDGVNHRFDAVARGSTCSPRHRARRVPTTVAAAAASSADNGDDASAHRPVLAVSKVTHRFDDANHRVDEGAPPMEAERTHTKLQTLDADAPEGDEAGERKGVGFHESATTAHECTPRWALTELGAHETRVYHGQIRHQVSCHIQEIAENGADSRHLVPIHTGFAYGWLAWLLQHVWAIKWTPRSGDGERHCADIELIHTVRLSLFGRCTKARDFCRVRADIVQDGPANVFMRLATPVGNVVLIQSVLPLAPNLQQVTECAFSSSIWTRWLAKICLGSTSLQLRRDIVIWNDKVMLEKPLLVKGDGPIMQFRTWMKQFAPPRATVKVEYEREH